mmetsp:Transcript_35765/g.87448  ORF Transcript_35765/g.87448 Transcript_35765/m.87448 type:complete len:93 (+) Transcript_35765:171-449(+)
MTYVTASATQRVAAVHRKNHAKRSEGVEAKHTTFPIEGNDWAGKAMAMCCDDDIVGILVKVGCFTSVTIGRQKKRRGFPEVERRVTKIDVMK